MAKKNPAAIFLILFAILAVVVGLSKVMLSVFDTQAMIMAFVPKHPVADEVMPPAPDYTKAEAWAALPNESEQVNIEPLQEEKDLIANLKKLQALQETIKEIYSDYEPIENTSTKDGATAVISIDAAGHLRGISNPLHDVFFIHPTTYMKPTQWNAAFDDASAKPMLESIALKNMAVAFDGYLHAPRYRQATTGAFYDQSGQGEIAKQRAYQDILAAYDNFMERRDTNRPFTLVGHSQGALHLLNLLKDRVTGSKERSHLIAAYVIGWPVSIEEDLDAIDMKACENENEVGCVISWMSFAVGADTTDLKTWYDASIGLSGKPRAASTMLCTNPLNWVIGGDADAGLNKGSVVLTPGDTPLPEPVANLTGATCKDGFLFVSPNLGPEWQVMDLGGGNLHFYDINLYWTNIWSNTLTREATWVTTN
jgi:hypothetical protein